MHCRRSRQRSAVRPCLGQHLFVKSDTSSAIVSCDRIIRLTWTEGEAMGWYNALIVTCRLSQCRDSLLGQQHPALFVRPGELSRSPLAVNYASCRMPWVLSHCRQHVDSISVTQQNGGSTYMLVLNFGHFFSLKVRGSTYMRIALYVVIYGITYDLRICVNLLYVK